MFYVYLLRSRKDGQLYTGSTSDLRKRLEEHNAGKVASTQFRAPFTLLYYEAYQSEQDARHREKNLKLGSRALAQLKKRLVKTLKID